MSLKVHTPCDNCKRQKEPCEWVPSSWVCSTYAKWEFGCMWLDMPPQQKRQSQLFIELDVEGDWVHWIKWLQVDKGKGQMETADSDPEDEEAWARYWVDVHWLAELSEAIACSFKALVVLLVEWLPVSMPGNPESIDSDEEEP